MLGNVRLVCSTMHHTIIDRVLSSNEKIIYRTHQHNRYHDVSIIDCDMKILFFIRFLQRELQLML
jgi:hypothetical protein